MTSNAGSEQMFSDHVNRLMVLGPGAEVDFAALDLASFYDTLVVGGLPQELAAKCLLMLWDVELTAYQRERAAKGGHSTKVRVYPDGEK